MSCRSVLLQGHDTDYALSAVKKQVTIVHSALEACKAKEAIVIATEWKEFREID